MPHKQSSTNRHICTRRHSIKSKLRLLFKSPYHEGLPITRRNKTLFQPGVQSVFWLNNIRQLLIPFTRKNPLPIVTVAENLRMRKAFL